MQARLTCYLMSAEHLSSLVPESAADFNPHERATLLGLARLAIEQAVRHRLSLSLEPAGLSPKCREPRACFVTLTKGGGLRGCIGTLTADEPLWHAVMMNARGAAQRDTRFPSVMPDELADLRIEISVLSEPRPLQFASTRELLDQLHPRRDGVALHADGRRATFLPQVWEEISDKTDFLERLCLKAGLARNAWRQPGIEVEVYMVEAFAEGG